MPPGGNAGKLSPGPAGIAKLRPVLVRVASSTGTKRNRPSGDHLGSQYVAQTRRGDPPFVGIARSAAPLLSSGTTAITHRRLGETP